jgi:TRAP-type C4-dicarboxylate transport system permease large subunit
MPQAAATAAAPQAQEERLCSRPPRMMTSAAGWSVSAAAVTGLCVMTVAARSGRIAAATASPVVPPSRMTVIPGVISAAALAATRRLLSGTIPFDLDGVLVDSLRVVERAWRRWAREQGLPADEVLAVVHGRTAREVVAMFTVPGH